MAKFYKSLIILPLLLFLSCQEGREAGDLLGQWRMTGSDTKYVSFAGSVVWFKSINEGEVFGKFQHVGDSLFIQCTSIYSSPSDTALIENSFGLSPFSNIRLKISALTPDKLVFQKDNKEWHFYKY